VLTSKKELRDWLPSRIGAFEPEELDAVIGLLEGPGAVMALGFGDYVLLRPEILNAYAQAVIRTMRDDPLERGCIAEDVVLRGELGYQPDFARVDEAEEWIVLQAMHKQLVERAICLREADRRGPTILVFPSHYRRERPERPGRPQAFVSFRFDGWLDDVYATLVVRLHHTQPFESAELWRNAADLRSAGGRALGLRLAKCDDGSGELELHCERSTPAGEQALFAGFVRDHLQARATEVVRLRTYICPQCGTPVENRDAARRRLERGMPDIVCSDCEHRIELWDEIEARLADPEEQARVAALRETAQLVLDSESRERLLVGEALAMASRAGQIARELTVADHGIDMEIEFRDDAGAATGRKLYLQLKSGDSHLRARKRDESRVFRIAKPRHADYWADQAFPVMLVVRDSEGAIEWMEIGETLRTRRATGEWPAHEIVFDSERFDIMSIRRWRDRQLGR
jgi:DNA-directed RNA polymerase subunit RPC12/RpoP